MLFSNDVSYYIISLGCSRNLVNSEEINGEMLLAGFNSVNSSEEADIIIINTCGFINSAKEESIEVIFDAIEQHKSSKIAVSGCLTQRYFDTIKDEIPEIDFIYGIPDSNFVNQLSSEFNIVIKNRIGKNVRKPLLDLLPYSYIKISEGCSNNCSYCAIPLIRGSLHSYPVDSILHDAQMAVRNGAKELIIVAQDITSYKWETYRLQDLIERISLVNGVEWIRLLYCHPDNITDEILREIGNNDRVVKYIDIPFQHASSNILHSMGRKGNFDKYYDFVMKLRSLIPGIRIRSTFMVGYPGESNNDFRILLDFMEKTKLDRVGAFMYSHEENTRAYDMSNQVPEDVKRERYEELMELQKEISASKLEQMINSEVYVLVEQMIDEYTYIGRTEFDAPEVDGVFFLTAKVKNDLINSIVKARVIDAVEYDLIGELV